MRTIVAALLSFVLLGPSLAFADSYHHAALTTPGVVRAVGLS